MAQMKKETTNIWENKVIMPILSILCLSEKPRYHDVVFGTSMEHNINLIHETETYT